MGDAEWRRLLEQHDRIVAAVIGQFRGRQVASTGDGTLATFDGPARAINCALALHRAISATGLELRIGLHAGEVVHRDDQISGIAVAIAARVMAQAKDGGVLVSGAVPPLVAGSGVAFADEGTRVLKGVPGEWQLFSVPEEAPAWDAH